MNPYKTNLVEENEMSMENIGGKLYATETFALKDVGEGVITKGQTVRHYEKQHPENSVITVTNFKLDQADSTVTIRVLVKKKSGVDPLTIAPSIDQKLLNPGYDEIEAKCVTFQREYDAIVVLYDKLEVRYSKLIEKYQITGEKIIGLHKKYDALVIEHEELKKQLEVFLDEDPIACDDCDCAKTDTNTFDAVVDKACDQAEIVGPDEDEQGDSDAR